MFRLLKSFPNCSALLFIKRLRTTAIVENIKNESIAVTGSSTKTPTPMIKSVEKSLSRVEKLPKTPTEIAETPGPRIYCISETPRFVLDDIPDARNLDIKTVEISALLEDKKFMIFQVKYMLSKVLATSNDAAAIPKMATCC
jgi:hypothetical protein